MVTSKKTETTHTYTSHVQAAAAVITVTHFGKPPNHNLSLHTHYTHKQERGHTVLQVALTGVGSTFLILHKQT